MNNEEIAAVLFNAFESGELDTVRSLCASDFRARQNLNPEFDVDTLVKFSQAVSAVLPDFRYEEIRRVATATGFVEEHMVRGTLANGTKINIAACVVADIEDGKIRYLREYLDSAAAVELLKALA